MTTVLATLGYRSEKVSYSIREESGVDRVVVFYGSAANRGNTRAVSDLRSICRQISIDFEAREIGSAYDFSAAVGVYRKATSEVRPHPIVFNTSGGTGVMQAAASFVCLVEGIPMAYYNSEDKQYVRMPTLRLSSPSPPSPAQHKILKALMGEAQGAYAADLGRKLRVSASNLDYHLGKLRALGFIEEADADQGKRRRRLVASPVARLLFG